VIIPPASTFMVERYLSPFAAMGLVASAARVADACARTGRDGDQVRYLHSIFLPAEDLCFCVFQGPSAAAIRAVNDAATFAVDRITDAVVVHPPQSTPYRAPTRQTGERSS
jgi:hypothetical protein